MEKSRRIIGGIAIGLAMVLSLGAIGLAGKALGWYDKAEEPGPAATLEALNFEETTYGTYAVSLKDYEATEVVIPNEYEGKAVTEIAGASEMQARAVTNSFNFSGGIDDLKDELTVLCGAMQEQGVPTKPGQCGFGGAVNLEKITIPDSVKVINDCAFFGCISLTHMEIPDSVIKIGANAFRHAVSLTEIKLPERLEHCGGYAFNNCLSLKTIQLPVMKTLPIGMFTNTALERIELPEGVESISRYAFKDCRKLAEIVLPEGLEIIEGEAFDYCTALKTVYNLSALNIVAGADTFGGVAKNAEHVYTDLPAA